ncbi:unnamed protein product [Ostreobium quekettii]|uniref:Rab-GAP TBC domain-containing protein n=1 Tax=Ostreobium quekettii TaxID=121088 RepID=A0A8S1J370_9CHLO|nr:unnamed protein product [Ostreobium quekettii]|eukprot:evm.model.scf_1172.2 EVM.evm.TU.scf_1172.2   scf_1172:4090-8408(-)
MRWNLSEVASAGFRVNSFYHSPWHKFPAHDRHPDDMDTVALSTSWNVISRVEGRFQLFQNELRADKVKVSNLRRLCVNGVPEEKDQQGLRAVVWKVLLGLLPPEKEEWEDVLKKKRAEYRSFCQELIIDPKKDENGEPIEPVRPAGETTSAESDPANISTALDVTHEDHPLSLGSDSRWNAYFKDTDVKEQIDRDVMRTHPDMLFFSGDGEEAARHREDLKRALFIFAKLNPGITYVQGLNEIYAPLYYVFSKDPDKGAAAHAEADAFFCFILLLGEFRDHFVKQLDNSQIGIKATIQRFSQLLKRNDEELWRHLEYESKVDPQYYSFRWITLLLTQEFNFADVLRLWDTLIAAPGSRLDFLLKACVAMLMHVRSELLDGDFSKNIKLLQSFPSIDVIVIIQAALEMEM